MSFLLIVCFYFIADRESGRSKGFAFVRMEDGEDARKALAGIHGRMIEDREVRVEVNNIIKYQNVFIFINIIF